MNIFQAITKLGGLDDKSTEKLNKFSSRREALNQLGNFGVDFAKAAVPFGLAGAGMMSSNKAVAQASNSDLAEVLNFALTLEYLESDFYNMGLDTNGLIPNGDREVFAQISKHEDAHVEYLMAAIESLGGTPREKPTFDFTAGDNFDPFNTYAVFQVLAQAFEDTGVRAYKGQAGNLMSNDAILTAALQIHSVEARHASEVRRMRGEKGWITQASHDTGVPQVDAVYAGEDAVNGSTGGIVDMNAITEAYDEPLTKEEVTAIASLFIES